MAVRTLRVKGFGVSVEVPEGVARPLRRLLGRTGRHDRTVGGSTDRAAGSPRIEAPPPVRVIRRDIDSALGFIRARHVRRANTASPSIADECGDVPEAVARQVAQYPWYHTIELPSGLVTPGIYDHRPILAAYGLPDSLQGKRVLDVGSADGYWAFELERRGGEVTSIDIADTSDVDLPAAVRRVATADELADPLGDGFSLAHRLLASKVKRINGSVYDLDPERLGRFDLVHCGDLLVHLRDPARAMEQIRAVTAGEALLAEVFDPAINSALTGEAGLVRYLGGWDTAAWWLPGLDALVQMVIDAGFSEVAVATVYNLPLRGEATGSWRAVLRARP